MFTIFCMKTILLLHLGVNTPVTSPQDIVLCLDTNLFRFYSMLRRYNIHTLLIVSLRCLTASTIAYTRFLKKK